MERNDNQSRIAIVIVMITSFITPFMSSSLNLAIPSIGIEFESNQSMLNWVVFGYLLSTTIFLMPFGKLADQFGRKKVFLTGMILLAVFSLGCALAKSLIALICFRVLLGFASAMIFSNSTAILTSIVPAESRGKALGFNSAATYVGLSFGPVLGGWITNAFTWRGIFYFILLMALFTAAITIWKLKGEWIGAPAKIDRWGIVLSITAQALLLFGLNGLAGGIFYIISFVSGLVLLVVFFIFEKNHSDPLIPVKSIFKNRSFTFSSLAALINYSATSALSFMLSLYLQTALGISTTASGLVLLIQPVMMAVFSPITGALSDKIKPYILASSGMAMSALGLLFFVFLSTQTPIALIVVNLGFFGLGFSLFASPNLNAIMGAVDGKLYGVASSIVGNMRLIGQSISMAVVSLISSIIIRDLTVGSEGYVDKLMITIRISFIIFTALCILGVFVSMVRGKDNKEDENIEV